MVKEYGYEYDAIVDKELWEKTKAKTTSSKLWGGMCLRSGRDALRAVAREYEPLYVLVPALSCDSMVLPFEMYGHKIIFYKITEEYKIDLEYLKKLIPKGRTIFLYEDYFGIGAIQDSELYDLQKQYKEMIFVEDRTHNFIWKRKSCFEPDYIVASVRKWTSIPDGALLYAKKGLFNTDFQEDTLFMQERLKAQAMRRKYFETGDEDIKVEYRQIFASVSDILDGCKVPARMSCYSYEKLINTDWDGIRERRSENSKILMQILKQGNIKLIQEHNCKSDLYVPFVVNDRQKQQELSEIGIFNTIIWPLAEKQKDACPVAKYTDEHMLAAPCDQRYDSDDMRYIGSEIVRVFNE